MTKVLLKKAYLVPRSGSRYPRGVYDSAALPYDIRANKEWVEPVEDVISEVDKQDERLLNINEPPVKHLNKITYKTKQPINVNEATVAQLLQMPGISNKRAQAIITNRPYIDMEDLKKRAGLTALNVDKLDWIVAPIGIQTEVSGMTRSEQKLPEPKIVKKLRPDERQEQKQQIVQKFVKEEL